MESLELQGKSSTLVDLVEEKLLQYLKENDYCIGSVIPNEAELSSSLGVARSVLREALSRLKVAPGEVWLLRNHLFWVA